MDSQKDDEISWRHQQLLAELGTLTQDNVMRYFYATEWFQKSGSNNETLLMQSQFNAALQYLLTDYKAFGSELAKMPGVEFVLDRTGQEDIGEATNSRQRGDPRTAHEKEKAVTPSHFIIKKQIRSEDLKTVTPVTYFLVMNGTIYQCATLKAILDKILNTTVMNFLEGFAIAGKLYEWDPASGFDVPREPGLTSKTKTVGIGTSTRASRAGSAMPGASPMPGATPGGPTRRSQIENGPDTRSSTQLLLKAATNLHSSEKVSTGLSSLRKTADSNHADQSSIGPMLGGLGGDNMSVVGSMSSAIASAEADERMFAQMLERSMEFTDRRDGKETLGRPLDDPTQLIVGGQAGRLNVNRSASGTMPQGARGSPLPGQVYQQVRTASGPVVQSGGTVPLPMQQDVQAPAWPVPAPPPGGIKRVRKKSKVMV